MPQTLPVAINEQIWAQTVRMYDIEFSKLERRIVINSIHRQAAQILLDCLVVKIKNVYIVPVF
jgi:hypothetical protein